VDNPQEANDLAILYQKVCLSRKKGFPQLTS